jgi:hypothetical protein
VKLLLVVWLEWFIGIYGVYSYYWCDNSSDIIPGIPNEHTLM